MVTATSRRRGDQPGASQALLDSAAEKLYIHSGIVQELFQQLGVAECVVSKTGKRNASYILAALTNTGVVTTGKAVVVAAERGHKTAVQFLLEKAAICARAHATC